MTTKKPAATPRATTPATPAASPAGGSAPAPDTTAPTTAAPRGTLPSGPYGDVWTRGAAATTKGWGDSVEHLSSMTHRFYSGTYTAEQAADDLAACVTRAGDLANEFVGVWTSMAKAVAKGGANRSAPPDSHLFDDYVWLKPSTGTLVTLGAFDSQEPNLGWGTTATPVVPPAKISIQPTVAPATFPPRVHVVVDRAAAGPEQALVMWIFDASQKRVGELSVPPRGA